MVCLSVVGTSRVPVGNFSISMGLAVRRFSSRTMLSPEDAPKPTPVMFASMYPAVRASVSVYFGVVGVGVGVGIGVGVCVGVGVWVAVGSGVGVGVG